MSCRHAARIVISCAVLFAALVAIPARWTVARGTGTVEVLYAGSLVAVNEHNVGPAFTRATGYGYLGEGKGSVAAANLIKAGLRHPDVFESADPAVNTRNLSGAANGNFVSWYFVFARTRLVLAYNPHSRFAAAFKAAARGQIPWYRVLEEPGLRFGRTDPQLDPKGYRTLMLGQLAERYYHQPGLARRLFGSDDNPAQVFPEETLVTRLQAGQLDAGVFYLNEAVEQRLPYLTLPPAIDLGEPEFASTYRTARYITRTGTAIAGAPILYTITIPRTVRNRAGAEAFVRFVVSGAGLKLYAADGVLPTTVLAGGNPATIPSSLAGLAHGRYRP